MKDILVQDILELQDPKLMVKCVRLGSRKDENNVVKSAPRPLLVLFNKPETTSFYHGNGKGVKSTGGYWINPNLSRLQREANFRARKFLRETKQKKTIVVNPENQQSSQETTTR